MRGGKQKGLTRREGTESIKTSNLEGSLFAYGFFIFIKLLLKEEIRLLSFKNLNEYYDHLLLILSRLYFFIYISLSIFLTLCF